MTGYRSLGIALALVGVLMSVFPGWFGPLTGGSEPPAGIYEAVERRIRGGMLLGVGLCFVAIPSLKPWSVSLPTAVFYFMTGALAARILGILLDGAVAKQWLWVAVEVAFMLAASLWLWHSSASGT